MYANLPNLVNHHSTFLQKLEERVKILQECLNEGGGEEKEEDSFSNLFLRHCGFLGEYQPYLTNYHRASLYCKYYGWKSPKVIFNNYKKYNIEIDYMILFVEYLF